MSFDNARLYHVHYARLTIIEEKAEVQDQYPLSLNPAQKADDLIQDRNVSIGQLIDFCRQIQKSCKKYMY